MSDKPGSDWRILAHCDDGGTVELQSPANVARSNDGRGLVKMPPVPPECIAPDSVFDEVVVDSWLHVEQMDTRHWWMQVGDAMIDVYVGVDGRVGVKVERGAYGPVVELGDVDIGDDE